MVPPWSRSGKCSKHLSRHHLIGIESSDMVEEWTSVSHGECVESVDGTDTSESGRGRGLSMSRTVECHLNVCTIGALNLCL